VSAVIFVASPLPPDSDQVVVAEGEIHVSASQDVPDEGILFAWPANEVLADLEVGEQLSMDPVGTAEIADDGSFEAVLTSPDGLDEYASKYGEVNLYLSADNGEAEYGEAFALDVADLADGAMVDLGEVTETGETAIDDSVPDNSVVDAYMEKSCSTTKIANLGNKWIPIGGLFSSNSGSAVDFQYSSGQSSSLGVAVSQKSSTAGFSASGTYSLSSTGTIDFPTMSGTGSKLAKTLFRFGNYDMRCVAIHPSGYTYTTHVYTVRADLWVGGQAFTNVSSPSATYCAPYLKGGSYTKENSKQVTWSGAASFYGVGLSAQTGWTTKGKLVYGFPGRSGSLCGSGGYATSSTAYQIVVK
jgi:hypothetical protein